LHRFGEKGHPRLSLAVGGAELENQHSSGNFRAERPTPTLKSKGWLQRKT
jgi:hypothetical protein